MDEKAFVKFLDDEQLISYVKQYSPYFKKIFRDSLKVKNEEVLIISDIGSPGARVSVLMAGCYWIAAKQLGLKHKMIIEGQKQAIQKAEDPVLEKLLNLEKQSVMAISLSAKIGSLGKIGKSFRKFIRSEGHRFVSTPNLSQMKTELFPHIVRAMNINYNRIQRVGRGIKDKLDGASQVYITSKAGTDAVFDIEGCYAVANTANYSEPGSGGNMPCGEVYIPPANANGRIVIDGSLSVLNNSYLIKKPVVLEIKEGAVVKIEGGAEAHILEQNLQWAYSMASRHGENARRVGELGIGINPGAEIIGPNIINEKTLGTAHIALGSNSWFGGNIYAKTHLDQVFRDAKVFIDGKELVLKKPRIF